MTSLCCVWSKIKWQCQDFFKPPWRKGRKQVYLNSNKTLKVKKGAAKIFKEYLKSENVYFEEFCYVNWTRCKAAFTWIWVEHHFCEYSLSYLIVLWKTKHLLGCYQQPAEIYQIDQSHRWRG